MPSSVQPRWPDSDTRLESEMYIRLFLLLTLGIAYVSASPLANPAVYARQTPVTPSGEDAPIPQYTPVAPSPGAELA
ncbi:hypothetical protein OE88DRAFT_1739735 [Heliocybe sulcata]|uniref:Uncharacterized protein n=1 Tax=Heliocybe sulcata TaxID=5364 RepID=A0A5C3MLC3_9AGAM|nr:hypothetical protein OE88DRAFT_1739735 [Heliocybe sulcata]